MKKVKNSMLLIRSAVGLSTLLASIYIFMPQVKALIADQNASAAAQKARSLKSIVQIAATEQLIAGLSHDDTISYLTNKNNLSDFSRLSNFPIYASEISSITLDKNGLIDGLHCTIIYNEGSYDVSINSSTTKVTIIADGE